MTPLSSNDRIKFATYTRDGETGIDHAMNRYYSSGNGRFLIPDPYGGSADPTNPGSWNRYAYGNGDPTSGNDPMGLEEFFPGDPGDCMLNSWEDGDVWGTSCGSGYPWALYWWPWFLGAGGGEGGGAADSTPPPKITLREIDDCTHPNGTNTTTGWTLEVEYRVLVNGSPVSGNLALDRLGISISESVVTTSGSPISGGGVWCPRGSLLCDTGGSMTASGTFWDDLFGGPSTANQTFMFNGQPISVSFAGKPGSQTVLNNVYNSPGATVSVGKGALVGNSKTRECGKMGDP